MIPVLTPMRVIWLAVAIFGLAFLILMGPAGFARGPHPGNDTSIYVYGGRAMSLGQDPYAVQVARNPPYGSLLADDCCFVNTPNFIPIAQALGLAAPRTAYLVVTALNFGVLAGFVAVFIAMMRREGRLTDGGTIAVVGLVMLSPFAANVIFLGQVTLLNALAVAATVYFCRSDRRPVVAGIALAVALFKPTISIYLVVWLLLEREWLCLAVAGGISLLLSAEALIEFGPLALIHNWLAVADLYARSEWNAYASKEMTGINALLDSLRLGEIPMIPTGIAAAAGIWWARARFSPLEQLGLLCGVTALFGRLHNYDLVVVLPLSVALFPRRLRTLNGFVWTVTTVLLYIPQRLVVVPSLPVLAEWRVVVIAVMMIGLLARGRSYWIARDTAEAVAPVMISSTM